MLYCPKRLKDINLLELVRPPSDRSPQDWDSPAFVLTSRKKIGTVQDFCWFSCKNAVLSQSYARAHKHTSTQAQKHAHAHALAHALTYAQAHTRVHTHRQRHTHTNTEKHTHRHTRTQTHMYGVPPNLPTKSRDKTALLSSTVPKLLDESPPIPHFFWTAQQKCILSQSLASQIT